MGAPMSIQLFARQQQEGPAMPGRYVHDSHCPKCLGEGKAAIKLSSGVILHCPSCNIWWEDDVTKGEVLHREEVLEALALASTENPNLDNALCDLAQTILGVRPEEWHAAVQEAG